VGNRESCCRNGRLVEDCLTLDLARLMRLGPLREGVAGHGDFAWSRDGEKLGAIKFRIDLRNAKTAALMLEFHVYASDGERRKISQRIFLTSTRPNFGGLRWWMRCPITGEQVRVLYLQPDGEKFVGRKALGLVYRIERISPFDRPFEKMFRAQRRLGKSWGLSMEAKRPKGMWRRTFARHLACIERHDLACAAAICRLVGVDGLQLSERGPVRSP